MFKVPGIYRRYFRVFSYTPRGHYRALDSNEPGATTVFPKPLLFSILPFLVVWRGEEFSRDISPVSSLILFYFLFIYLSFSFVPRTSVCPLNIRIPLLPNVMFSLCSDSLPEESWRDQSIYWFKFPGSIVIEGHFWSLNWEGSSTPYTFASVKWIILVTYNLKNSYHFWCNRVFVL